MLIITDFIKNVLLFDDENGEFVFNNFQCFVKCQIVWLQSINMNIHLIKWFGKIYSIFMTDGLV